MKSLHNKTCTNCSIIKCCNDFRKNRNICKLCEAIINKQRCSGDRICTNCHSLKLELEFNKHSRHCKECRSAKSKIKLINMQNDDDQTKYISHLQKNSKNNVKRYKNKEIKFDTLPIKECYIDFLSQIRKNANSRASQSKSRASQSKISCDIDLAFIINLYHKQNSKCALTGISFNLNKYGKKRAFAPSIDRINCNIGYTKNNVRLVCLIVNLALNDFGDEAFDIMCRAYNKIIEDK